MSHDYSEPQVSFVVLDFMKPELTAECLNSIRQHVKFPHKIVYLHNGPAPYAYRFYEHGLVDHFVQTANNDGLGIGTRNAMAAVFSPYTVYWQNDQLMGRDFTQDELRILIGHLNSRRDRIGGTDSGSEVKSISLAGALVGHGIYSERAHFIETKFYREMEHSLPLSYGGAGPYSHVMWREEQIQKYYKDRGYVHYTDWTPMAIDKGVHTIRPAGGGLVKMRTDTKAVWWIEPPKERYVFPEHTEMEWAIAMAGAWPGGKIPQIYLDRRESFNCWGRIDE
jgi:hypothetical protein